MKEISIPSERQRNYKKYPVCGIKCPINTETNKTVECQECPIYFGK